MRNTKSSRTKSKDKADELPAELDPRELRFVGFGLDALSAYAAGKGRRVDLDPDVAEEFHSAEEVNETLRLALKMRQVGKQGKRRKSA